MNRRGFLKFLGLGAASAAVAPVALAPWAPPLVPLKAAVPVVPPMEPFVPELWAKESLKILQENMVMGNLVKRDFTDKIAKYDDSVNAEYAYD